MNFREFWDKNDIFQHYPYISGDIYNVEIKCAEYGWNACKKEVLKILNEHPNLDDKTSLARAFKKIEEL